MLESLSLVSTKKCERNDKAGEILEEASIFSSDLSLCAILCSTCVRLCIVKIYIAVKQTLQLILTFAFYVDDVLKNLCSLLHYCGLRFSHCTTHVVQHLLSGDSGRHTFIFIVDELVYNTSVILSNDTIGCM